jgi:hypothetical protein
LYFFSKPSNTSTLEEYNNVYEFKLDNGFEYFNFTESYACHADIKSTIDIFLSTILNLESHKLTYQSLSTIALKSEIIQL